MNEEKIFLISNHVKLLLIDSGSDSLNVKMAVSAADIVFLPLMISKQDVHPAAETFRAIVCEQRENSHLFFGGIVFNQNGNAQWENTYITNYQKLLDKFINKAYLKCVDEKNLFQLKQSRIIKRGTHLRWSWREDILNSTKKISDNILNFDKNKAGV